MTKTMEMMMVTIIAIALMAQNPVGHTRVITHSDAMGTLSALKSRPRGDRVEMVKAILVAAKQHKVDPLWLLAVSHVESRHKLTLVGDGGNSFGPFQMCLGAARVVHKKVKKADLHKWPIASDIAARYWARLFRKYGPKVAPVIYNCGPIRCKQADGSQRKSTPATRAYWRAYRRLIGGLER